MKLALAALGPVLGLAACASAPALAPPAAPPTFPAAQIELGAGLAKLGDCQTCHTAEDGAPFAGGRPIGTPFGQVFATNITPDPKTGIGAYSQAAFRRAMRQG